MVLDSITGDFSGQAVGASEVPRATAILAERLDGFLRELQQMRDGMDGESLKLHTNVSIQVHGADGALKDERRIHNLICAAGKNKLLAVSGGEALTAFTYIAIGTGTTAASASDTALQTELARSSSQTPTNPSSSVFQAQYTFPAGTGTGAITEAGLLDASSGGNLLAHQVFAAVNKASGDSLTIQWQIS